MKDPKSNSTYKSNGVLFTNWRHSPKFLNNNLLYGSRGTYNPESTLSPISKTKTNRSQDLPIKKHRRDCLLGTSHWIQSTESLNPTDFGGFRSRNDAFLLPWGQKWLMEMSSSAGPDDQILPLQDLHLFSPSRRRSHVGISIEVFTM